MIVAWQEVPGKSSGHRPENRPVGYGMIGRSPKPRSISSLRCVPREFKFRYGSNHRIDAHTCANQTVPYGTALLGGAVPSASCQLITSLLRTKNHRPSKA